MDYYPTEPTISIKAFELELLSRGLALRVGTHVRSAILKSDDEKTLKLYDQWKSFRQQITYGISLGEKERQYRLIDLASLEKTADSLEKVLNRNSYSFANLMDSKPIN